MDDQVVHATPASPDRNRPVDLDNDGRFDAMVGFEAVNSHDRARTVEIDNDGDLGIVSIGWSPGRVIISENKAVDRTTAR